MWELLATSHDPITANKNLSNKPYFYLGLLSNLEYLLRPVDAGSIILEIFDPFSTYIPRKMASHWECWNILEQNKQSLNLMCFGLPRKLDVCALQRLFLYVRFGPQRRDSVIIIIWSDDWLVTWGFSGILVNIWSEPGILWVNIILCTALWDELHKICQFLVVTVENLSSNTKWYWVDTQPVSEFRTRATDHAWNCEGPRYIPASERGSHLGSTTMLPWNIESNT